MKRLAAVLAMAWVAVSCSGGGAATPAPPMIPGGDMEAAVAEALKNARARVVADGDAAAWGELGVVFHAHGLEREAGECYAVAEKLDPREVKWPYLRALLLAQRDPGAAVAHFERAAGLGPSLAAVYGNFAATLLELGRPAEAAAQYEAALTRDPDAAGLLLGLARARLAEGRVDEAARSVRRSLGADPRNGPAYALLATIERRRGDEAAATAALALAASAPGEAALYDPVAEAVSAAAVNSRAVTDRGRALAARGDYAAAEAAFRRVLKIRPPNARDLSNLGVAIAAQERYEEALEQYQLALNEDPGEVFAYSNMGLALLRLGAIEDAERILRQALELDPGYAEARANLALQLAVAGRLHEAATEFGEALEVRPSMLAARSDYARTLAGLGRVDEAVAQWELLARFNPGDPGPLYETGGLLAASGRQSEAIAALERALSRAPNSSRLVAALAWELATAPDPSLRDGARAVELAQRAHDAYPFEPALGEVLAAAHAEAGAFERAAEVAFEAQRLAEQGGDAALARRLGVRVDAYRRGDRLP